jgi:diketogulonate reductase-like aldo/keto reductase
VEVLKMDIPNVELNNGLKIPAIGFGTWDLFDSENTIDVIKNALNCGYRVIDTAKAYRNESSVGKALKESRLPREDIFLTTKLWGTAEGYSDTIEEFNGSLERLEIEYVDLYLIHSPNVGNRKECWRALEELYKRGKVKSIGVSNYSVDHLNEIIQNFDIMPAVNQIEFHPYVYKNMKPIMDFCNDNMIIVEAYSPLARGRFNSEHVISEIAKKNNKTGAQVMLRWAIQHGAVPIPKTASIDRMKKNLSIFDFELSNAEMNTINSLSSGEFLVLDPSSIK